jgi:hypothetical protein
MAAAPLLAMAGSTSPPSSSAPAPFGPAQRSSPPVAPAVPLPPHPLHHWARSPPQTTSIPGPTTSPNNPKPNLEHCQHSGTHAAPSHGMIHCCAPSSPPSPPPAQSATSIPNLISGLDARSRSCATSVQPVAGKTFRYDMYNTATCYGTVYSYCNGKIT